MANIAHNSYKQSMWDVGKSKCNSSRADLIEYNMKIIKLLNKYDKCLNLMGSYGEKYILKRKFRLFKETIF